VAGRSHVTEVSKIERFQSCQFLESAGIKSVQARAVAQKDDVVGLSRAHTQPGIWRNTRPESGLGSIRESAALSASIVQHNWTSPRTARACPRHLQVPSQRLARPHFKEFLRWMGHCAVRSARFAPSRRPIGILDCPGLWSINYEPLPDCRQHESQRESTQEGISERTFAAYRFARLHSGGATGFGSAQSPHRCSRASVSAAVNSPGRS
jgi:hypothetical protein